MVHGDVTFLCVIFPQYLDKIGKAYFGMPDQPKSGMNLLDLLGGGSGGGLLGRYMYGRGGEVVREA